MGASTEAASFAGIRVKRIKTMLFVASGVVCALAGVLWTFRLATAVQNNGVGVELNVVAIVLLGGVSIFGGKGSIGGVVLAVLAFAGLQGALLLTNFNQEAIGIVIGGAAARQRFRAERGPVLPGARARGPAPCLGRPGATPAPLPGRPPNQPAGAAPSVTGPPRPSPRIRARPGLRHLARKRFTATESVNLKVEALWPLPRRYSRSPPRSLACGLAAGSVPAPAASSARPPRHGAGG